MNNVIGLAIFALGIFLLISGFNESQSFGSNLSRVFAANPTDRSLWMMVGGSAAVVSGLFLAVRRRRV
jgi:hypothetical protein